MASSSNRRRQHHTSTGSAFLFLAYLVLIPFTSGSLSAMRLAPRAYSNSSDTTKTAPTSISFSSAVLIESSVSNLLAQLSNKPVIPLPSYISNYDTWAQVASLMPPLQTNNANPAPDMLSAAVDSLRVASRNNSTLKGLVGRQAAIRVMIVGDSMTEGREGDWTWRYRIWEWFNDQGVAVSFVGPYSGTVQPDQAETPSPPPLYGTPQPTSAIKTSGGYAAGVSSDFVGNHFAVWGRAAAVDKGLIQDIVAAHPADLMLLMLGFNDMGWFYSDAHGTLDSIQTLITNARAANPNLKFAVANVPQRSLIGGREDLPVSTDIYNGLLNNTIPSWSTAQSPIHLVDLQGNYDCETTGCPAGTDGLHPNALGEYQIARAFTLTLVSDFQIGSSPLTIPNAVPTRPLPVPSNFQVSTSPGGVTATWDAVYGAYGYDVQSQISGGITDFSPGTVTSNRWDAQWPLDGWVYDVQVRASAGDTIKGPWTSVLTATAHPQTAPGPVNVVVQSTATGFDISWDPPTGEYTDSIIEYNILYWDKDGDCSFITGAAFTSSPAQINDLVPGHHYLVAPLTWNSAGQGFPEVVNSVTIGEGTPSPPTNLNIIASDPTTIHMTWEGSSIAAGYRLWSRNINNASSVYTALNNTVDRPCDDESFLFPGTWNFEWCVSAFNGNAESPKGDCVVAPSPASSAPAQTCPPAPAWCPNGPGGGGPTSTTIPPGSGTSTPTPTSSNQPWPSGTDGQCRGPDCINGQCTGIRCVSLGCQGPDCLEGVCTGTDCIVVGCIGPGCVNGVCTGSGCVTSGCVGPQCGSNGQCNGDNCIALGCSGPDCGANGICSGPNCWENSCQGANCVGGSCNGPSCTASNGCSGIDCQNGQCTGPLCSSCTGTDCSNGDCTGPLCTLCFGSDCHNGHCTGPKCQSCTGEDCHSGQCTGPLCSSCLGSGCDCSGGKCGCKGPDCSSCSGLDCSCSGSECSCGSGGCNACHGLDCDCTGPSCGCQGPSCSSCDGPGCSCSGSGCSGGQNDRNPSSSSTCQMSSTVTDCTVACSVTDISDSSYTTNCYTTQCSTLVGCDETGMTTTTETTTAFCPLSSSYSAWSPANPNALPPTLGSDNQWTVPQSTTPPGTTTPPITTPPATTTTQPPLPTLTGTISTPLCFSPPNYLSVSSVDVLAAISGLCNAGHTLGPSQTYPYIAQWTGAAGDKVDAEVGWAQDQTGCGQEKPLAINNQTCNDSFDVVALFCKEAGGGYIADEDSNGCVFWSVGAPANAQ